MGHASSKRSMWSTKTFAGIMPYDCQNVPVHNSQQHQALIRVQATRFPFESALNKFELATALKASNVDSRVWTIYDAIDADIFSLYLVTTDHVTPLHFSNFSLAWKSLIYPDARYEDCQFTCTMFDKGKHCVLP